LTWDGGGRLATIEMHDVRVIGFRVTGFLATCRMEARVAVPSSDFSWKSDPIDKCPPAAFAVIGDEVNGKYYEKADAK
jgi:hypothetical protein